MGDPLVISSGRQREYYSWDGTRFTLFLSIPGDLSCNEIADNIHLLHLVDRQLRQQMRRRLATATTIIRATAAKEQA